jgi:predicted ferric reductase
MKLVRLVLFVGILPLITLLLWIGQVKHSLFELTFWDALHQVAGWLALSLFVLSLITATRLRVLQHIFSGFDQVYQFHKYVGITAFLLLWVHADATLIQNLDNLGRYLIPSTSLQPYSLGLSLGIVAFYLILLLGALTYIKQIPYHIWKLTHEFMSVGVILGSLHALLVRTATTTPGAPLSIWLLFLTTVGIVSALYIRFFWKWFPHKYEYILKSIEPTAVGYHLSMSPVGTKKMSFVAGQLVFVSFLGSPVSAESHPYSISSAPSDATLRLSIKKLGDHTTSLGMLTPGTAVTLNGPYGTFGEPLWAQPAKKAVLIAGGIGITPFMSMLREVTAQQSSKKIDIWYLARNPTDAIFHDEIQSLLTQNPHISLIQKYSDTDGYTTADTLRKYYGEGYPKLQFFLCGPKPMMDLFLNGLIKNKVAKRNIFLEDFSLK